MGRGKRRHKRCGVSLVVLAISIVVMLGMSALAIDLGMLLRTRAEAQRAADAAALAGVSVFAAYPPLANPKPEADTRARYVASQNTLVGVPIDPVSEVVQVTVCQSISDPDPCPAIMTNRNGGAVKAGTQRALVRIRREAVPTVFARVFGVSAFPIGAKAVAEASLSGGGVSCTVPLAMPDAWTHAPVRTTDALGDYVRYAPPGNANQTGFGSTYRDGDTGLANDFGLRIALRPKDTEDGVQSYSTCPGSLGGNKCVTPGWWGLWGPTSPVQTPDLQKWFAGEPCLSGSLDETYILKNGWVGTLQGQNSAIHERLVDDRFAVWDETIPGGGVTGSNKANWIDSPRVLTVAVFNPNVVPSKSDKVIEFTNFIRLFFEGCANAKDVLDTQGCKANETLVARYIGPALGLGPGTGTLVRTIRLVESAAQ